ncbi:hypothetical protein HPB50_022650 [Hyalomma asiaticum]|uniref:Uncharacterized protein n=1 Tax=Hyalomma asiaticum TaxID=266040 RepID=A0ACB7RVZ9_HYAAI|nr:hypothetical protein HPB50_022650 [Hyalomma asiaticum]
MIHFLQRLIYGSHSSRNVPVQDRGHGRDRFSSFDVHNDSTTTGGCAGTAPAAHLQRLGPSIAGFAVDLYRQLALHAADVDDVACSSRSYWTRVNVVFSPFAVAAALSMTLAGARGRSAEEIASVLHIQNDGKIHGHFSTELTHIASRTMAVTFEMANHLYSDQRYPVSEAYLAFLRGTYGEDIVNAVDFAACHREVREEANERVAGGTVDMIHELLTPDSVGPTTQLAIVSAAYLYGPWESPFQPAFTGPDEFHVDGHTAVRVDMMNQMHSYGVAHCDQLQATALEMPHLGGKTSMVIILPDKMDGLSHLEGNLTAKRLSDLLHGLRERPNVMLRLPKFAVVLGRGLRDALRGAGVRELFTAQANLAGMFEAGSPALADVFHGAFLEVNEEGAELPSLATDAELGGGPGLGDIMHFVVNRPFMFLVGPRRTNVFFLMGSVRRP